MKPTVKCESEFFLRHMMRKLSEAGSGWTAMDAYLQMVDTCNRCPIADCPGMLATVLDGEQPVRQPYGDLVPLSTLTGCVDNHAERREEEPPRSLHALASAAGTASEDAVQPEACPDLVQVGDRSAFARLLGWEPKKASR